MFSFSPREKKPPLTPTALAIRLGAHLMERREFDCEVCFEAAARERYMQNIEQNKAKIQGIGLGKLN